MSEYQSVLNSAFNAMHGYHSSPAHTTNDLHAELCDAIFYLLMYLSQRDIDTAEQLDEYLAQAYAEKFPDEGEA